MTRIWDDASDLVPECFSLEHGGFGMVSNQSARPVDPKWLGERTGFGVGVELS